MMKKHLFFVVRKGSLIVDYEIQTPNSENFAVNNPDDSSLEKYGIREIKSDVRRTGSNRIVCNSKGHCWSF